MHCRASAKMMLPVSKKEQTLAQDVEDEMSDPLQVPDLSDDISSTTASSAGSDDDAMSGFSDLEVQSLPSSDQLLSVAAAVEAPGKSSSPGTSRVSARLSRGTRRAVTVAARRQRLFIASLQRDLPLNALFELMDDTSSSDEDSSTESFSDLDYDLIEGMHGFVYRPLETPPANISLQGTIWAKPNPRGHNLTGRKSCISL
eukprot:TRINITY_DN32933_c0_g1_i1.p1 TRINITY_DN32933_c0_g1~~TRINITY_DN32933_c0_g1_i1.p1  ORF type:complete len:201 (-),score=44.65 TRINITY_DN32933_c0_g1_i1:86-688(-)